MKQLHRYCNIPLKFVWWTAELKKCVVLYADSNPAHTGHRKVSSYASLNNLKPKNKC